MALGSPGVQVQVIDESFYTPAAPGTVPMIFIATAQDKSNAAGTATAQGTTAANAGKIWVITSQRDLVDTFGAPKFTTDTNGNSVHGDERNEYGLQAAYSLLGVSSKAYVVRADLDLNQIAPASSAPTGDPTAGQYWVDTDASLYGINEWNATTLKFTLKTPLLIDGTNASTDASNLSPKSSFGKIGDYAIVVTADNTNKLWYKTLDNIWTEVINSFDNGKSVVVSPHTEYPSFDGNTLTGSVWIKTTAVGGGANWSIKYFNGSTKTWSTKTAPIYRSTSEALKKLDYVGGGKNIPVGDVFIESSYDHDTETAASFKIWRRAASSPTTVSFVANTSTSGINTTFYIRETVASSTSTSTWNTVTTVTVLASNSLSIAEQIPSAISQANLTNISARFDTGTRTLTVTHALGGDFELRDSSPTGPLYVIGIPSITTSSASNLMLAPTGDETDFASFGDGNVYLASNWKPLTYVAKTSAPTNVPNDGTLWFANNYDTDIMYHNGSKWVGYRDSTAFPNSDPDGPIISATAPTTQSDNTALVTGDIWISTANPERYGRDVYVYDSSITVGSKWVLQDVADQETPNGWVFADARWATNGTTLDPSTIKALLASNYVDPDAPDPALYPKGVRLWNTRRSGNNVKKYISGYINTSANDGLNIRYNNEDMNTLGYKTDRWVSQENRAEDGSGVFGRKSQRAVVTGALKSLIDSNTGLRDTDTLVFNLMATPGYVETIQNMLTLNADRGYTAFVVGDTPFRLEPNGTTLSNWGSNAALAASNGDDGLVSYDDYGCLGVFYPSGFTNDLSGNNVVVPPSHMILRTMINSDAKSYQWFAPAGLRRGGIDNATSVGYIDANSGEYKTVSLHEGLRDILQQDTVKINPIATLPGIGLVNFGQKTRYRAASALDRINVARLVCYLRRQLGILAKPFLFEPNDEQTRREIKAAADSLLLELVGQRALYDFLTVCDSSNNTPARIDRNELWLDIAIEPVKAVEFIYIPLRIKNTGEISAGV
jgi:hypothetical protein